MTIDPDWDAAAEASRPLLSRHIRDALLARLTRDDHLYDGGILRVGSDLKPQGEVCDREIFYRLKGAASDPPQIARRLRYERGRVAQKIFVESLRHNGHEVVEEVSIRAMRPTAWAWSDGHGDVLDVKAKHLYEIKAPGGDAWRRARGLPVKLVREAYRWQLSWYFHELVRLKRAETASWVFFDMEGEFDPVEVALTPDLIVPLNQITAIEEEKSRLTWAVDPPARPRNTVEVVKVLKGGRKTKKNPNPDRRVVAVERRYWGCSYCNFQGTCNPGPEEIPVELSPMDPLRIRAVHDAEEKWAQEDREKTSHEDHEPSPSTREAPVVSSSPASPQLQSREPLAGTTSPPPEPPLSIDPMRYPMEESSPPRNGHWIDDRTKAEKSEAARILEQNMAEIDERAVKGEPSFDRKGGAASSAWNEHSDAGEGW